MNGLRYAAILLFIAMAAPASAQIDTDPTNDTAAGGNTLSLAVGAAISNLAELTGEGGDVDYFNVSLATGNALIGMITPVDELPFVLEFPDTTVSVIQADTQRTFSDDDGGATFVSDPESVNRGSLFRYRAGAAGTYNIGVTGFGDYEFDGNAGGTHAEYGQYVVTAGRVNPATLGGGFADTEPNNNTTAGADLVSIGASGAVVSVVQMLASDVDYYKLTLSAGDVLSAMTAPLGDLPNTFDTPDTLFGLYDSSGTLLAESDDAGDFDSSELNPGIGSDDPFDGIFGSAIRAIISTTGTYYLRVEESPLAEETQIGRYAMLIGVYASGLVPFDPGDFNEDGSVNTADYVVWRKFFGDPFEGLDYEDWVANFASGVQLVTPGDFNEDGSVDTSDYVVWRKFFGDPFDELDYEDWVANFGQPGGGGGSETAVPEPATAWLLFFASVALSVGCQAVSITQNRNLPPH